VYPELKSKKFQLGDLFNLKFVTDRIANFFRKMVKDAMEYREKNNVTRKDFIDLLMQLKKKGALEGEEKTEIAPDANYDAENSKLGAFLHEK